MFFAGIFIIASIVLFIIAIYVDYFQWQQRYRRQSNYLLIDRVEKMANESQLLTTIDKCDTTSLTTEAKTSDKIEEVELSSKYGTV